MLSRHYLLVCATLVCCGLAVVLTQGTNGRFPRTKFTCQGRPSGYYADVETECQVYHMCDELGRQFSYSCPNTTLFQQRMLICDHWYMVDCKKSEKDYDANLLIGQRDKPFVSDEEMRLRTPRPDILGVPPNNNYYDGLKEAESKYPVHPGNSIVGVADSISNANNNGLDSGKNQYRPPTSWSSGTQNQRPTTNGQFNQVPTANTPSDGSHGASQTNNKPVPSPGLNLRPPFFPPSTTSAPLSSDEYELDIRMKPSREDRSSNAPQTRENRRLTTKTNFSQRPTANTPTVRLESQDNLAGAASQKPSPTYETVPDNTGFTFNTQNTGLPSHRPVPSPSLDLSPPFPPTTETPEYGEKKATDDPVFNFIKRFDPNSPDSHKTAMTTSEILDINQQLPEGHDVSSEDERTPRKNKNNGNNFNTLESNKNKGFTQQTRFDSVNTKNEHFSPNPNSTQQNRGIPEPDRDLLPPKKEFPSIITTTEGPPVYYQWKWAVPAFDLEPPKPSNDSVNNTDVLQARTAVQGESPFAKWTTTTTEEPDLNTLNTEYNISSYFVPDYQFPLDKPHPGYEDENAQTSFRVKVDKPGTANFGENPACPHCHPAYLKPGTCEPCIVQR